LFGLTKDDDNLPANLKSHYDNLIETKKQVLEALKLLIIDEVSLLKGSLLDFANGFMTELNASRTNTKGKNENEKFSFGGIRLLVVGDHCQLPPVVKKEERFTFFFQSETFKKMDMNVAYLKNCHRNSGKFNLFLNLVRNNQKDKITEEILKEMNSEMMGNGYDDNIRTQLFNIMATSHNELLAKYTESNQLYHILKDRRERFPKPEQDFIIDGPEFIITTQNNQRNTIIKILNDRNTVSSKVRSNKSIIFSSINSNIIIVSDQITI
jgi:hypothetical protein